MATAITVPSTPGFRSVEKRKQSAVANFADPYVLNMGVQAHTGTLWNAMFRLPPMVSTDADDWIQFFEDLNGMANYFVYDTKNYRLKSPIVEWMVFNKTIFQFQEFQGIELKT